MQTTLSTVTWANVSRLATLTGAVQLIGLVLLIIFFIAGEPYGTLNDLCIALTGLLSAALAWQMLAAFPAQVVGLGRLALVVGVAGALIAVIGSVLVVTRSTGWVLAGLWNHFGFAWVGAWLLVLCSSARSHAGWPGGLIVLGLVTGVVMLLGVLTLPGILRGLDAWETLPGYVNLGQAGALGWLLLYPIWCLWLGRVLAAQ